MNVALTSNNTLLKKDKCYKSDQPLTVTPPPLCHCPFEISSQWLKYVTGRAY